MRPPSLLHAGGDPRHTPVLWALAALSCAGVACRPAVDGTSGQDALRVTPTLLDLGDLPAGTTTPTSLRLDVPGEDDVRILEVEFEPVLGDAFMLAEVPTWVRAQDFATLELVCTLPTEGLFLSRLHITWDPPGSEGDADLAAEIVTELRAHAFEALPGIWPPVLDFGNVATGGSGTAEVTVTNEAPLPFRLWGATLYNGRFEVEALWPVEVPGGGATRIPLRFSPLDADAELGTLVLDGRGLAIPSVQLRANDCEHGDAASYDLDADGYATCGGDCDDATPRIHPGATETPDDVDDDCDGIVDEGTVRFDDDGDGFSEDDGDCADQDPTIHPAARERYDNGVDDDCDGVVDAGTWDGDGDGWALSGGDCDDAEARVHPGAVETPNGEDDDCDGIVDEGTEFADDDGDGYSEDAGDCHDGDPSIRPGEPERPDGIDNDCDGLVDEGTSRFDDDGDGYTEEGGDCDDSRASIHPGQLEIPLDGLDNDCDGTYT